jgi:hypothetical protein
VFSTVASLAAATEGKMSSAWQKAGITFTCSNVGERDGSGMEWVEAVPICPYCRCPDLRHGAVQIFERAEDSPITMMTTVDGGTTTRLVSSDSTRNPSNRRHGLVIAFACDNCSTRLELTVAEHKGVTLLGWRFQPCG